MLGKSIIEEMLRKAEQAEQDGNIERAEYWLRRASETEERLKKLGETNDEKA